MPCVAFRSTRNCVRPPCRCSPASPVRASRIMYSERCALEVHSLVPLTRKPPPLSATAAARVRTEARSEPESGSLMPMQNEQFARRDARQDRALLLLGADAQQQRPALPVGHPVAAHRRARGEHFLQHHVALERAALVPAVALGPGHADPAARAHLAAEFAVAAAPGTHAFGDGALGQVLGEEGAHLGAQHLALRKGRRRLEAQVVQARHLLYPAAVMPVQSRSAPAAATAPPRRRAHQASLPNSSRQDHRRRVE